MHMSPCVCIHVLCAHVYVCAYVRVHVCGEAGKEAYEDVHSQWRLRGRHGGEQQSRGLGMPTADAWDTKKTEDRKLKESSGKERNWKKKCFHKS